jgi:hypothetical protein
VVAEASSIGKRVYMYSNDNNKQMVRNQYNRNEMQQSLGIVCVSVMSPYSTVNALHPPTRFLFFSLNPELTR